MSPSVLTRAGLAILALAQASVAVWGLAAPRSFYDSFPGGGRSWVAPLGPYDEHLVRDVGALSLALVVVVAWAAVSLDRRLVIVAACAWLAWAVPHLAFHLAADEPLATADRVVSEGGEALTVAIAVGVLWLQRARPAR